MSCKATEIKTSTILVVLGENVLIKACLAERAGFEAYCIDLSLSIYCEEEDDEEMDE